MNFFDKLLKKYYEEKEVFKREIGRYWATDIYNILNGSLTPQNFFEPKKITLDMCKKFYRGEVAERALIEIVKNTKNIVYQDKKEIKIDDFVLVCKTDIVIDGQVFEIKGCNQKVSAIKQYNYPQLEAYYQAYKKEPYILYVNLNEMEVYYYKYNPNPKYWELIVKTLKDFHNKLCQIHIEKELTPKGKSPSSSKN